MGVFRPISISSYDSAPDNKSNPNPNKYHVIKYLEIGKYLIVLINYPDCSNFEGDKILVYDDCKMKDLLEQKIIDPHFSNNPKYYSPLARFKPTEEGWKMAESLCLTY